MSQFREALGLKPMYGPRTLKRFERNEQLRQIARQGYQVIDTGRAKSGGTPEPRPRRGEHRRV